MITDVAKMFDGVEKSLQGFYDKLKRERKPKDADLRRKTRNIGKQIARLEGMARKLKTAAAKLRKLTNCRTCP